jgi:hypothetical protein
MNSGIVPQREKTLRTFDDGSARRSGRERSRFFLITLLLLFVVADAQEWVRRYHPPQVSSCGVRYVSSPSQNGLVAAGGTGYDATHEDYFLTIGFDTCGETTWTRLYDYDGHGEVYTCAAVAPDGRTVVCGQSWSDHGGATTDDWAVACYRPNGDSAWAVRFGPLSFGYDSPRDIAIDGAGNAVVTGRATFKDTTVAWTEFATLFIDTAGVVRWVARSDSTQDALCVALDSAGNSYVGGIGGRTGRLYPIIKYGPDGAERWHVQMEDAIPFKAAYGPDGSVYFTGAKHPYTTPDYWVAKLDTSGQLLWERTYNGGGEDHVMGMALDDSCNVYITGYSSGFDICTASWDSAGNQRWVARYGGTGSDIGYALCLDQDFVYVVGFVDNLNPEHPSDACLFRYAAKDGTLCWAQTYDGPAGLDDQYYDVCIGPNGRIYAVGMSTGLDGHPDALVGCYLPDGSSVYEIPTARVRAEPVDLLIRNTLFLHDDTRAVLLDATGRRAQELKPGLNDVSRIPTGVYFMCEEPQIASPKPHAVHKVVVTH